MSKMSFDPIDAALSLTLAVTGFIMVGIATFSIFNVDFSATAFTLAGNDLSTAYLLSVGALVGTVLTNDNTSFSDLKDDAERLDDYYYWTIIGTFAVMAAWPLIGGVPEFFQSEDLWGLAYVVGTTTAQMAIGYIL